MNNENLMIFYYLIKSELEKLKSDKLSFSRLQPCEIVSKKIGYKEKRKIEKMEKLRRKIESGFVHGVDKSIKILDKEFNKFIIDLNG